MRNILVLGGNYHLNKGWAEEISKQFTEKGDTSQVHYYEHWDSEDGNIDMKLELSKLDSLPTPPTHIFAKSAGVILTLQAIKKGIFSPRAIVAVGIPIAWAEELKVKPKDWIENLETPTLLISKPRDPVYEFNKIIPYLERQKVQNYETWRYYSVGEVENDHIYLDIETLVQKSLDFFAKAQD